MFWAYFKGRVVVNNNVVVNLFSEKKKPGASVVTDPLLNSLGKF